MFGKPNEKCAYQHEKCLLCKRNRSPLAPIIQSSSFTCAEAQTSLQKVALGSPQNLFCGVLRLHCRRQLHLREGANFTVYSSSRVAPRDLILVKVKDPHCGRERGFAREGARNRAVKEFAKRIVMGHFVPTYSSSCIAASRTPFPSGARRERARRVKQGCLDAGL